MNSVRLGDLIVHAGLATEDQVVDAIDGQSGRQAHIGSMFVERGILSSTGLRTAVQVQSLIRDGRLSLQSGSRLIAMASRGEISTTEIQAELDKRAGQKQPTTDER
ncbi:MAG: hypothetical protein K2Z81_05755, partial [Cyanobacteria bacterium]|nr:hypothetical protein [Cyanobacteriota bacterium]